MPFECRKADRAASKWWTTRSASKDSVGELLQANRDDESEEGISDRDKPFPSRGAVKTVSILRSSSQAVLQRRKRDPKGDGVSEAKS
jgi:hypothetical protein